MLAQSKRCISSSVPFQAGSFRLAAIWKGFQKRAEPGLPAGQTMVCRNKRKNV